MSCRGGVLMLVFVALAIALAASAKLPENAYDGCPGVMVFFAPHSAQLDRTARKMLSNDWIVQAIHRGQGGTWVKIIGSTDDRETGASDRGLSQRRANSV